MSDLRAEINRLITQREVWLEKLRTVTAERDEARALLARCLPAIPPSWPSWMALRADVEAALGKEQTNE